MSLLDNNNPILNVKATKNRQIFEEKLSQRQFDDSGGGNRLKIGKGHIIEANCVDTLKFFSTHHDYRKGKIRENYVPQFPQGKELFKSACLEPGPQFDEAMYNNLAIECRDPNGEFIFPEQIDSFEGLNIHKRLLKNLNKMGIIKPLPVQCFMIPFLLNNTSQDILASAPTGCGKTLAVLLPLIEHCIRIKKEEKEGNRSLNAPLAIVIGATRDLVYQLHVDALRISYKTGVVIKCAYGEYDRATNGREIREGCDVLIATVGRFVDLVDKEDVFVNEARFLAVDEADKLVTDEIFQDLMIVLQSRVRSDITHALFSATFSQSVRMILPRLMKYNFVQMIMHSNGISPLVEQHFFDIYHFYRREHFLSLLMKDAEIIAKEEVKYDTSGFRHPIQYRIPKTIVYGECRRMIDYLAIFLSMNGIRSVSMHGGRSQKQRNEAYTGFMKGEYQVLVASNVAARGLNFPKVKQIINYDPPTDMETYIHRIGRAGRLGSIAKSFTYFNRDDVQHIQLATSIVEELKKLGQPIPPFLSSMCEKFTFGDDDYIDDDKLNYLIDNMQGFRFD